jgi:hypothetical protein
MDRTRGSKPYGTAQEIQCNQLLLCNTMQLILSTATVKERLVTGEFVSKMNICLREQNIYEKTPYVTKYTCKFYCASLQRYVYLTNFFMFLSQFAVCNTVLSGLSYSYHNLTASDSYFIPVSVTGI